jgi:hypothetical protein
MTIATTVADIIVIAALLFHLAVVSAIIYGLFKVMRDDDEQG